MRTSTELLLKTVNINDIFNGKHFPTCSEEKQIELIDAAMTNILKIIIECSRCASEVLTDGVLAIDAKGHSHETATALVNYILNFKNDEKPANDIEAELEDSLIDMIECRWVSPKAFLVNALKYCVDPEKVNCQMAWRCQPYADLIHWHCERFGGKFNWENGSINASKIIKS